MRNLGRISDLVNDANQFGMTKGGLPKSYLNPPTPPKGPFDNRPDYKTIAKRFKDSVDSENVAMQTIWINAFQSLSEEDQERCETYLMTL